MKKIISKVKKMKKSYKIIIGSSLLVLIAVIVIINLRGTAASLETVNIPNKIVDGISFENAVIEHEDGISTFKADVYNENKETYELKYITIIFTDEDGTAISLNGYIGDSLESDEGRKLIVGVDDDLSNTVDLDYVINK